MGTSVVERCDLDVLDVAAAVRPLVFKAQIRQVDVPVEERQIVLVRPLLDLSRIPVWTSISVGPFAVSIVEKLLVLAFELVVEDDAMNPHVLFLQTLSSPHVGGKKLRVVRQFASACIP